jgi:hypothetical protein
VAAKLSARDVEQPSELLDEILSSPAVCLVGEHGHEIALTGRVAEFFRAIEQGLLEDQPVTTFHRIPAASVYRLADQRRGATQRAAELLDQEPEHPRVVAARERVRARRAAREA